ncbi:MAG: Fe-S cluster assembly protein SufD [Anaerolineae bacterium]|nr:Fe-S cluster assembly protein SufD [Chloroflexota bacterium]MBN8636993.1 Fe-S cluster assembly protein SufD [Anaerolineae bacterium]
MTFAVRRRSASPEAPIYTPADIDALSTANNEPDWLRESRHVAWELYEMLPMPGRTDEEWRRTDYRGIRWDEAQLVNNAQSTLDVVPRENLEPLIGDQQGGTLIFVDGKVVFYEVTDDLRKQGVIFTDLVTACREYPDLVRERLMTQAVKPSDGKFAALHAALWTHGVFLYVPRGKMVELPLHVVMYHTQPGATLGHVLVALDEAASATILVDYLSPEGDAQSAYIGATELLVGERANLRYVGLQDWNRETYEFSHQRGRVGKDATLDWVLGTMGGKLVKAFIEVELDGYAAQGRVSGMFFADGVQMFDHDTQQNHNAPMTKSDLLFKGAAKDEARSLWQGMIKSQPQMQKIDGFQASRNLVLSEDARMDAIPGLEIEADDVRCTHAATFGTLEEAPVFYLMSRGIPRPQAELMVTEGFFEELLERIPFERVQDRLRAALEAKIVGVNTLK